MNKLLTTLDRLDCFLMNHPWAAMLLAVLCGTVFAVVVVNLP